MVFLCKLFGVLIGFNVMTIAGLVVIGKLFQFDNYHGHDIPLLNIFSFSILFCAYMIFLIVRFLDYLDQIETRI